MESKEDSIKILEKRIRQQMNYSLEKYMKPENIQYYASSSEMLRKQELQQEGQIDESGDLRQGIQIDEKGNLQRNIYIDEKGNLQWGIYINEKENTGQEIHIGGRENLRQDIYTDEGSDREQEAVGSEKEISGQSDHEDLLADMEYIDRINGMARMIEYAELSETKEAQHTKAKSGYESVLKSSETEKSFQSPKSGFLDAKG